MSARDVLIAAAIKQLDWSWEPGGLEQCLYGEYRIPPSPEECFEDVADAQLVALAEAGYVVVHAFDDAWLEARGGPHG